MGDPSKFNALPLRAVGKKTKFIRHALEQTATQERQLALFDRLFDHAQEDVLNESRKKLKEIKRKYFNLKREKIKIKRMESSKKGKDRSGWQDQYDEICIKVEEYKEEILDHRFRCRDDENTRIAAWRLLLPRLVPEYKVIEVKDGSMAESPLVKALTQVLKGKIENNEVTNPNILDDIDDAVYNDVR